ncbi:MAG: hypothetical protein U0527_01805 [Candidatus Eisenbacteria bacterium]
MTPSTSLLDLRGSAVRGELAWRFVRAFFTAVQTRRLRGAEDPQVQARLTELLELIETLAAQEGAVRLQRFGPHLWVGRTRLRPLPEYRLLLERSGRTSSGSASAGLSSGQESGVPISRACSSSIRSRATAGSRSRAQRHDQATERAA